MSKERDTALDGVRGIAILLVMVGHCIVLNGLSSTDPYLYDAIKSVQMPLFMLLSGIAAGGSVLSPEKLPRRMRAYLLPFFSWFVVSYLIARIRDALAGKSIILSPADFLLELKDLLFQTDRGLWFLMTLFVITAVMTLAVTLAGHLPGQGTGKELVAAVLALLFWGCFILQARSGFTLLSPALTVSYMPYYCLGYFGKRILPADRKEKRRLPYMLASLPLFALFAWLVIRYPLADPVDGIGMLAVTQAASLCGTVSIFLFGYAVLSAAKPGRRPAFAKEGFLAFIGQYTLEIYVLHFRFATLLGLRERGLSMYTGAGILWLLAAFLLMSLLTALCILLLKRVRILDLLLFGKRRG